MKLGSSDISKIYLGSTEVSKAYLGATQVYGGSQPLPYDAEVEYIQGGIFDTSFVPSTTGVHTWEYMFITKVNYAYCFGTKPVESGKWMVFAGWNNNTAWSEILYGSSSTFGWNASNNTKYSGEMNMSGQTKTLKINGSTKLSLSANSFTNTNPFSFQLSKNGTIANRLYWYKIVEDGILKLDIIPVRVGSVGYLYDRVSGELISNSDTVTPVIGPDKN